MKYITIKYTVEIEFTTANEIFRNFQIKNFRMRYKIRKNWYTLLASTIKFFGTRSIADKYLGGLTFDLR